MLRSDFSYRLWLVLPLAVLLTAFVTVRQVLAEDKASLSLIAASTNNFPPINLLDNEGELTGFGRELAEAVVRTAGGEVTNIHSPDWTEVLAWLAEGRADFIQDTAFTQERTEYLDFSEPILEMPEVIFVRKDNNNIRGLEGLFGKTVACVDQHISHLYLKTIPEISCYIVKRPIDGIYALINGDVDAFVYPRQIVIKQAQTLRFGDRIKTVGEPFRVLTYHMTVKKGNRQVLDILNRGLTKVRASGEYAQIYKKWLGERIFSGYSMREVHFLLVGAFGISLLLCGLAFLFIYAWRTRKSRDLLRTTLDELIITQQTLQQQEKHFRSLIENATDLILVLDHEGKFEYLSPSVERIVGFKPDELVGQDALSRIHDDDLERTKGILHEAAENLGNVYEADYRYRHKDGTWRHMSSTGRGILEADGTVRIVVNTRDRTEAFSIEQALQESERRFRQLAENLPVVFWIVSNDWKEVYYVSPAYSEIWGADPESLYRHPSSWLDMVHEEDLDQVTAAISEKIGSGYTGVVLPEYRIIRPDGFIRWIQARASPVRDEQGDIYRLAVIAQDITKRREAEKERENFQKMLMQAQKMEAIGTLAAGIAHDFNNILSIILGYTELTRLKLPKNSKNYKSLSEVLDGAIRAKGLVNQILAFGRESEGIQETVDLGTIVNEVMKLIRATIPATIEIQINLAGDAGPVFADPVQMHQVLMNLCTNAYQAMSEKGGVLSVSLESVHVDEKLASSHDGLEINDYIRLNISDTGVGMDSVTMSRIFDPFFTTRKHEQGTGLGMSVVHGIVKSHDGAILVESEPGKGTTVIIYLPEAKGDSILGIAKIEGVPRGSESILLVDDEPALAAMGEQILQSLGYSVTSFSSSLDAIEDFRKKPDQYDLVITDQTMPGMTGVELAREIRALRKNMPIILCSGFNDFVNEEHALQLGVSAYLRKPIDRKTLAQMVRKVLDL